MRVVDLIRKKRDGGELTLDEIAAFVQAASHGTWPDYQLSALLMAICIRGMTDAETAHLTRAMTDSGVRVDLSNLAGVKVDKHSTGGVGDKTSLILGPLAAACGVVVPMMSGRGLGHTGGTLDKLEAIPGFRVNLSIDEFQTALRRVGIGMIGQTADVAPADKKLYALRDVTGTVESVPLITASILSKKIAEGISALVMDVKCGRGAFMKTLPEARALAQSLVRVGTANGLKVEAIITKMDAPLGRAVGNANEVAECIAILNPESNRPPDALRELSILLAAKMVLFAGIAADQDAAVQKVEAALMSGAALEKFRQMVAQQGGDPRVVDHPEHMLPQAPHSTTVHATRAGWVTAIDAEKVGVAAMLLGAGRQEADESIDHSVGIHIVTQFGEQTRMDGAMFNVHYRDEKNLTAAKALLSSAFTVSDTPPSLTPTVLETIT